ncbi:MAG TPA: Lin1244/Lin1753 domain-containing protein, partial [Candidatus Paceibacterota bacterium]|nr:Lin1244/Lin1753 domain-containing protein [Candidatus Paceibacterota bacterium]
MKKNAYYFSHDTNASRDEKILAMRVDYGWEGYGWFWAIIEAMAEATDYRLRFSNGEPDNIDIAGLALNFRVSRKKLEKFVENCIKKYKLFVFSKNKKYFFSKTLRRRLLIRNKKTNKLRVSGKKGAKKRWNGDSHPNGHPNGKERKGNEIKGNTFSCQGSKESPDSDNTKIAYKATCYLIDK